MVRLSNSQRILGRRTSTAVSQYLGTSASAIAIIDNILPESDLPSI
ncbi:hypothetical protein [Nostoc mirabile]|nr:hypothetical protein [Nostoc mirabile]